MFWIWFLLATSQCALLYILARRGESMPRRIEEEAEANRAILAEATRLVLQDKSINKIR